MPKIGKYRQTIKTSTPNVSWRFLSDLIMFFVLNTEKKINKKSIIIGQKMVFLTVRFDRIDCSVQYKKCGTLFFVIIF